MKTNLLENKTKAKLFTIAILAITVATLASTTLAYFNAESTAHNVITTSGVDIEIQEWSDVEKTEPFEDLSGVMPGATKTKIAEVKNTGGAPAWIRVKIEKKIELKGTGEVNLDLVKLDIDTDNWITKEEDDGWYYYKTAVQANAVTEPIFTTVTFDTTMGNEYQNSKATVTVYAQAVQSDNNGTTVTEAQGWPAE